MKILTKLSNRQFYRRIIAPLLAYVLFLNVFISVTIAGPEGAQVINGQVSIQQSGSNTAITASDKAIINYNSFDIARPETVQFIQPGSNASVLNRILSANPTNINGMLLANGRVFFVNPAGVYIGDGARINVNQFVASALNISNADFISGNYNFAGGNGVVINDGDIFAEQVYLIGKQVTNSGNISCPDGYVVMAAGDRVFLGEPGSDIILDVEGTSLSGSADAAASETGVLNEGTIDAAGGIIALAAAGDIYSQAISNVGTLSTSDDAGTAGQIKLAAVGGEVVNTGTIEASGSEGGQVAMEGDRVGQFGTIHADGTTGDGGNVDMRASDVVALSSNSLTTANAGLNGNGGEVIAYSPETALFWSGASIEAKGGSESGNGGFVEVSGKEHVEVYGIVDTSALNGNVGTFLIDPYDIVIGDWEPDDTQNGSWDEIDPQLWAWTSTNPANSQLDVDDLLLYLDSTNVEVQTGDVANGNITVADPINYADTGVITYNDLTLKAHNDVIVNAEITTGTHNLTLIADSDSSGAGDVDINAAINSGGSVEISGSSIEISSDITADTGLTFNTSVIADGVSAQTFDAGSGTLTAEGNITNNSGFLLTLGGGGGLSLKGDVTGGSITLDDSATVEGGAAQTFDAGSGTLTAEGDITNNSGFLLTLGGGGGLSLKGNVTGGSITLEDNTTADGGATQTFDAGSGTLTASGTINKSTGDLVLGGDTDIDLDGAVTVSAGSLTVSDSAHIADNINAAGIAFSGMVTADGTGPQTFDAGSGTLTAEGNITNNSGFLLTLGGGGGLSLKGNVTGGSITLEDNTTADGGATQTFDAGSGTLTASGMINKSTGNLVLGGDTDIDLDGAVTVSAGSLTVSDSAHIADDITAAGVTFSDAVTTDGTSLQTFDAGTGALTASNTITKTGAGGLTLAGVGGITLADDVSVDGLMFDDAVTATKATDQTFDAGSGTLTASGTINKSTGNLVLGGDTDIDLNGAVTVSAGSLTVSDSAHIANNITAAGIAFSGIVTADGGAAQTFDAGSGTLNAEGNITNNSGFLLTLGGGGGLSLKGNVTGGSITLEDNTTADGGATQTFDAGSGTLTASGTINKSTGNLVLGGDTDIDLDGTVTVSAGSLTVSDSAHIANNINASGIAFSGMVTADGTGPQTFDAGTETLSAGGTISKASGDLVLGGDTGINLDNTDVQDGSLSLEDNTSVAPGHKLQASGDIILAAGKTLTGEGTLILEATGGVITADTINMSVANQSLSLTQNDTIDMADFSVTNYEYTNLILDSKGGSAIVTSSAADDWLSITAAAEYNVTLSGNGDIRTGNLESRSTSGLNGVQISTDTGSGGSLDAQGTINSGGYVTIDAEGTAGFEQPILAGGKVELTTNGDITTNAITSTGGNIEIKSTGGNLAINGGLTATTGGVSLISETGKIYTDNGGYDTLDVPIIGYSDTTGSGVALDPDKPDDGKAAIVIRSPQDLILGDSAKLDARGTYTPGTPTVDDRSDVDFDISSNEGGEPIDVAIYLRSNRGDPDNPIGNVTVKSEVVIADYGTMVVDAGKKVIFNGNFYTSIFNVSNRLEVVSRISNELHEVISDDRLPYARYPEAIRTRFEESTGHFTGAYVLRGKKFFAEILDLINPVPLVPPRPLELEVRDQVERPDTEALEELLNELGIGVQPYVTDAYAASLSTDLRLYGAAEKLQRLIPVLEDADGTRVAGLRTAVAQFFPSLDVLSEELMDSFAQELTRHKGDGTDYDLAGQCIFALTEYVNILGTEIGWPVEKSVGFVMGRYVPRLTEGDEIRMAVIQIQLQKALGV